MLVKRAINDLQINLQHVFGSDIIIYDKKDINICGIFVILSSIYDMKANITEPNHLKSYSENATTFGIKGRVYKDFDNQDNSTLLDCVLYAYQKNEPGYKIYFSNMFQSNEDIKKEYNVIYSDITNKLVFDYDMRFDNNLTFMEFLYLTPPFTLDNNLNKNKKVIKKVEVNVNHGY